MAKDNQDKTDLQNMLHIIDDFKSVKVLKTSAFESTELVYGKDGTQYIRKTLYGAASKAVLFESIKAIDSTHLQKVYDIALAGNDLLLVCEYVQGETLRQQVESKGVLGEDELVTLSHDLCDALSNLHNAGSTCIVHRDVNPNNIIMRNGGACLIDFGIARTHTDGASRDTNLWGTAGYAAPEQFGFKQTDARTDIYALGQVMRFAISGKDPDEQTDAISAGMKEIIARCCAIDPANRFWTIDEFRVACDEALGLFDDAPQDDLAGFAVIGDELPREGKSAKSDVPAGMPDKSKSEVVNAKAPEKAQVDIAEAAANNKAKSVKINDSSKPKKTTQAREIADLEVNVVEDNDLKKKTHSRARKALWIIFKSLIGAWCICDILGSVILMAQDPTSTGILYALCMIISMGFAPWIFMCAGFGITKRIKFFQTHRYLKLTLCMLIIIFVFMFVLSNISDPYIASLQ